MAKVEDRALAPNASLNDDIGEERRLRMYRMQVEIREAEQRAFDLFLQNLVKGTSHLSLGQEAVAAGCAAAMKPGDFFTDSVAMLTMRACACGERTKATCAMRGSVTSLTYCPRPWASRCKFGRGTERPI